MIIEIITTGTELLLGEIANENSQWLASFLNEHGYTVAYMTTVGDNPERMCSVFRGALRRADLVITTGGLGSTQGDVTKRAGAEALGLPFVLFPEESARLRAYYEARGRTYLPAQERQAWFAEGAELLPNDAGSASGCAVTAGGRTLIHLPGPPFEMKQMAEHRMMPWLIAHFGDQGVIRSLVLSIENAAEVDVEKTIMDLVEAQSNPTIALYARPGYIAVRLTAKGQNGEEAMERIRPVAEQIMERLPALRYNLEEDARRDLVDLLTARRLTMSAAESCTGGLIGKLMTDWPGSSAYFMGSAVTYWNSAKEHLLHVAPETLERFTAVSEETAREMAEGSRALYGADLAVSTTGYAGPGKGERGEPEGLVYIGVSGPAGTEVHRELFLGSRKSVRYGAAEKALFYAAEYIRAHRLGEASREERGAKEEV